jgi:hypothetical protein
MSSNDDFQISQLSRPLAMTSLACVSIGLFICLEMFVLIFITFKRYSGIYFWTLTGATVCQTLVCISTLLAFWIIKGDQPTVSLTIGIPGYLFFVPLEGLVLYSRLHLLGASRRSLRFVLGAIAFEFVFAEIPCAVMEALNPKYGQRSDFFEWYKVVWREEAAMYMVMHLILMSMFFSHIRKMWGEEHMRGVLKEVALMIFMVFALDVVNMVLNFTVEVTFYLSFVVSGQISQTLSQ